VWDHFIWQYYLGPVWADAHQCSSTLNCHVDPPVPVAASEGYTLVSELTYGVVLATALYAVFQLLFKRAGVRANGAFIAALIPFILLGPTARVLEDMNVFMGPDGIPGVFAYLFISPVIYVHVAVYAITFTLIGLAVERARDHVPVNALTGLIAALLVTITAAYAFIITSYASGFQAVAPVWVIAGAAVLAGAFFHFNANRGKAGVNTTLFALGIPFIAGPVYLIIQWTMGNVWSTDVWSAGTTYPLAAAYTLLIAAVVTLLVALVGVYGPKLVPRFGESLKPFAGGLNLGLVFGHMVDGVGTWIAMNNPFGFLHQTYGQKHPVSDLFLQLGAGEWWAGLGFPAVKLVMILVIIWLLDREFKGEDASDQNLVGLIKLAVLVLGIAPGTRDMLRITMGV
jgi:uncharacterized membrane protein